MQIHFLYSVWWIAGSIIHSIISKYMLETWMLSLLSILGFCQTLSSLYPLWGKKATFLPGLVLCCVVLCVWRIHREENGSMSTCEGEELNRPGSGWCGCRTWSMDLFSIRIKKIKLIFKLSINKKKLDLWKKKLDLWKKKNTPLNL